MSTNFYIIALICSFNGRASSCINCSLKRILIKPNIRTLAPIDFYESNKAFSMGEFKQSDDTHHSLSYNSNNINIINLTDINKNIKNIMLDSIKWYKSTLSPIMPPNCRFLPTWYNLFLFIILLFHINHSYNKLPIYI